MSDASDFAALHRLTPSEAVAYLQARGKLSETFNWQDMWQEEHTRAFTVSRLAHADLLQTFSDKITASVQGDLSRTDFMRSMKDALQKAGWWGEKQVLDPVTGDIVTTTFNPSRLKLIYDTNVRTAHAAGRWQSFEASRATHPYIRYITKHDERVRASHAVFDGVTLPIDDAFWNTHTPPLGYRCRCRLVAVNPRDYDKGTTPTGAPMRKAAPDLGTQEFVNTRTGEVSRVPVGITPGFGYNPGKAAQANTLSMASNKLAGLSPKLAAAAIVAMNSGADAARAFAAWRANPQGNWPLVYLPWDDLAAIGGKNPVATLSKDSMAKQEREHPEIADGAYLSAQSVIDAPTAKVQDGSNVMIYIKDERTDQSGGTVVVVKTTTTGNGTFVTSIRRLSRDEAEKDRVIRRLLKKGN